MAAAPPAVSPALDAVNGDFHAAYDAVRDHRVNDGPVFVVLADSLVVVHGAERRETTFTPRRFHAMKSVVHGPVAAYVLLHAVADGPLATSTRARIEALREHVSKAGSADARLGDVRARTLAFLDARLTGGADARALHEFASGIGSLLDALLREASALQVDALHEAASRELDRLSADERARLQVVVTGDHQARVRSLGMQYFQARLGERSGADRRVAYGEGIADEEGALALVGTRRLDAAMAEAFFGDERRLQRDLLGDAVRDRLRELDIAPD